MKTEININGPTIVVGDIHGSLDWDFSKNLPDKCNIILLGDVGIGFRHNTLYMLSHDLKDFNLFLIRGNHDDPSYWEDAPYTVGRNITFLPDGYITINGELYLIKGGGISVDKNMAHRIAYETWWPEEVVDFKLHTRCKKVKGLLTHSGLTPTILVGKKISQPDFDGKIQEYINKEQDLWETIIKRYKPEVWYHGHFHLHETREYKGVKIHALDCYETMLISDGKG